MEAVASTDEDGVAYLYHAGLDGFEIGKLYYVSPKRREIYENPGFHTNSGPDRDRERVYTRGRTLTLGLTNGSVAVFPSPHRFFWGGQTENIVGNNYYIRQAGKDTMAYTYIYSNLRSILMFAGLDITPSLELSRECPYFSCLPLIPYTSPGPGL